MLFDDLIRVVRSDIKEAEEIARSLLPSNSDVPDFYKTSSEQDESEKKFIVSGFPIRANLDSDRYVFTFLCATGRQAEENSVFVERTGPDTLPKVKQFLTVGQEWNDETSARMLFIDDQVVPVPSLQEVSRYIMSPMFFST